MSQIDWRIAIWNANGLKNHINELEHFLLNNNIDILLISESHCDDRSFLRIRGYDIIYANHPNNVAYGGAAIIIKKGIIYDELDSITTDPIQCCKISVKSGYDKIIFASIYCRPRFNLKENDFNMLFGKFGNRFIAGGDFNCKHTHWGSRLCNPKGRELLKSIYTNNLTCLSGGGPTYWPSDPNKTPDLLDFFIYKGINSNLLMAQESFELNSDHTPVIAKLCMSKNTKNYQVVNYKKLASTLGSRIDNVYSSLDTEVDIDDSINNFTKLLKEEIDNCSFTPKSEPLNPSLLSDEIRKLLKEKSRLRRIFQRTHAPQHRQEYNKAAKLVSKLIKKHKEIEMDTRIGSLSPEKSTNYDLWKAVKNCKKFNNPPIRLPNGTWLRTSEEKAEMFKEHLEGVFRPHEYARPDINIQSETFLGQNNIDFISKSEIKEQIKKLNPKKASGPDGVTAKCIRVLPDKGIDYLVVIFNAILKIGYFPSDWRRARIIMIPKPGKPQESVNSYRPISILSTLSKLFERIFLSRMEKFISLPDSQFGFRVGHGTPEQCHRVVEYIREAFEKKQYVCAVFLDISQAFDKVWHKGLLTKLSSRFPKYIYLVLQSYLKNRTFNVMYNDHLSTTGKIESGVPQGSVIGPILFNIYTADQPILESPGFSATYADDTAFAMAHQDNVRAARFVQDHLEKYSAWCEKWKMRPNPEKSTQITFTLNKFDCPNIKLGENYLPCSDSTKYLGLHIDRRLTFAEHIKMKRKQADLRRRDLYWILGRRSSLSLENKIRIYKTVLLPIICYCAPLWGLASKSNIKKLQAFQNITLRVMTGAPTYVPNEQLHKELNLNTVEDLIMKMTESYKRRLADHINSLASNLGRTTTTRLKKKIFM